MDDPTNTAQTKSQWLTKDGFRLDQCEFLYFPDFGSKELGNYEITEFNVSDLILVETTGRLFSKDGSFLQFLEPTIPLSKLYQSPELAKEQIKLQLTDALAEANTRVKKLFDKLAALQEPGFGKGVEIRRARKTRIDYKDAEITDVILDGK